MLFSRSRKGGINARVLETSEVREQGKMGRIADGWGRDDLTLWKPNSTVKFLFYTTPRAQHRRFLRNQPLYLCLTDLDGTHVIGLDNQNDCMRTIQYLDFSHILGRLLKAGLR